MEFREAQLTREDLEDIKSAAVAAGTPAAAMEVQRDDARAMMRNFLHQYPFNAVRPIPTSKTALIQAGQQFDLNLTDGTILLTLYASTNSNVGSWAGRIPVPWANDPQNTFVKDFFGITTERATYFVYGKKQITIFALTDAFIFADMYLGNDGLIG